MLNDILMSIDGRRVAGAHTFAVIDPTIGEAFAEAPDCSVEQLDDAVAAANRALPGWQADEGRRRAALRACAEVLLGAREEIADLLCGEQGKPRRTALFEVGEAARWLSFAADLPLDEPVIQDDEVGLARLVHRPLGVVAAITAWNYPILFVGWKVGPALLAGNTMVLKPSPFTPMATLRAGELLLGVLPVGVLNVVSGTDEIGARMTTHSGIRKISFTGSVETGKRIAAAAAPDLKRYTLELGGNDAAIVLDDVDVAKFARRIFWAAFINNGQICAGIKRLYVAESVHDDLVAALAELARTVRVGAPDEDRIQIGPVQNRPQFDRVRRLTENAVAAGAQVAAGGAPLDRPGYFWAPTILTEAVEGMAVVDEEQFGPVLPVMRYRDIDDAVTRANASTYGLSGSVWGQDTDRAAGVAARLECGTAYVNDHLTVEPHLPFGGAKSSGVGVENGTLGLHEYTQLQVQYMSRA